MCDPLCNRSWSIFLILLVTSFDVIKSILSVSLTTYCKQFSRIFVLYAAGVIFHKHLCEQYSYQSIRYRLLKTFPFWFFRSPNIFNNNELCRCRVTIIKAVTSCDYSYYNGGYINLYSFFSKENRTDLELMWTHLNLQRTGPIVPCSKTLEESLWALMALW
jgi:hypothetical protein